MSHTTDITYQDNKNEKDPMIGSYISELAYLNCKVLHCNRKFTYANHQ